jgi:hypothetical protein
MGRGGTRGSLSIGGIAGAGSWPEQLPCFLAEARCREGFVAREDALGSPGPRSLAEHLEHLEWAAAEVGPVFR